MTVLLEASPVLENIYVIISIVMALATVCTTVYAIYQKIKAGDFKGAKEEADKLLTEGVRVVDKIKKVTDGMDARCLVKDALKDHGETLDGLGLKEKMDAKLKELGLEDKS